MYVQFTDSNETEIQSIFSCAQDSADYPNQGTVEIEDARYLAFTNPVPTVAQQAVALINAGLSIVSTTTPALNGTYALDQLSQIDIIAIETSLAAGKGFPGGATAFAYPDMSGVMHLFTAENFTDFAAVVRDYVYALRSAIAGTLLALPSGVSTIP